MVFRFWDYVVFGNYYKYTSALLTNSMITDVDMGSRSHLRIYVYHIILIGTRYIRIIKYNAKFPSWHFLEASAKIITQTGSEK